MTEYRYTTEDRIGQLIKLVSALKELLPNVQASPEFAPLAHRYELALSQAEGLLRDGFTQEQLSNLGRSVPDLFLRHKEWRPPLEKSQDGQWREPEWFSQLESKLQPVLQSAGVLFVLGHY